LKYADLEVVELISLKNKEKSWWGRVEQSGERELLLIQILTIFFTKIKKS
jgi:hypothetical protein